MRLTGITLAAYGACTDVEVPLGPGVTVVLGVNEAGKSTALEALSDLLWGIPLRTSRTFLHPRSHLRIDATVTGVPGDGGERRVVRKAVGLLEADLATPAACPWDPAGSGTADWWRTRLGLDLDQLRAGGEEVFSGGGDIAELVFAAREGRSARDLLEQLRRTGEDLFKAHGGAKSVRLRQSFASYEAARAERDERVTRSDLVTQARQEASRLDVAVRAAQDRVADATRRVRVAEEDVRVIAGVLDLTTARAELAALESEGPRLPAHELTELEAAQDRATTAREELVSLEAKAADIEDSMSRLAVDEALLSDAATLARLHPQAAARIADLHRAEDEYGPAAAQATETLVALLAGLGVAATPADVDGAVAAVRVGAIQRAELDDVAERLETARDEHATAIRRRDESTADLQARGVAIDPATVIAPRQDVIEQLRRDLVAARASRATKSELLEQAAVRLATAREAGPVAPPAATLNGDDVAEARSRRDAAWQELRRAWLDEEHPSDRAAVAQRVDEAIAAADAVADAEAIERARTSAHDARLEAHGEGVEAERAAVGAAEESLAGAVAALEAAQREWDEAWAALGVVAAPSTDAAPELLTMIATAVQQQALMTSAAAAIAEAGGDWQRAVDRAALPEDTTTTAWRARVDILDAVEAALQDRRTAHDGEARHRSAWQSFADEAAALLSRHGELEPDAAAGPADIERGLTRLESRRTAADVARGQRETLAAQLTELNGTRADLAEAVAAETQLRTRLAARHGTDAGAGLDALAERARRAADPLDREATALLAVTSGLDPGTAVEEVLARLAGADAVGVEQARESALTVQQDAQEAVNLLLEERTTARDRRDALESAGSAAAAEAEVELRRSELIGLAERWSIVTLQRLLLEKALARLGTDDSRPLLDRAGRILQRITAGRYVALRAQEDATSRTLRVLRVDGTPLETGQLSEGTADQVYFALRLAAAAELHEERMAAGLPALPFVLDDVLMAFDDTRTSDALRALHDLADGLQVIVFTHHARVADLARAIDGVVVTELPVPAAIEGALDADLLRATAQQGAPRAPAARRSRERDDGEPDPASVRAWAVANGIEVSAKGRIPGHVLDRYRAAHG